MSACNNLLWAGLGLAAGYALALYVEQTGQEDEPVDDDECPPHPFEYIDDEPDVDQDSAP